MKPGLTVRDPRSIRVAPGGAATECAMALMRLPSTRISAGPDSVSDTPSNTLPHANTIALIAKPSDAPGGARLDLPAGATRQATPARRPPGFRRRCAGWAQ